MRIAFLFDQAAEADDSLHFVVQQWLNGLVESQNQVKVLAPVNSRSHFGQLSDKIEWAEPVRAWGLWEFPKVLGALLPFNPEVIHLVLGRKPKLWQLWPLVANWPGSRVVVSLGDGVTWPKGWSNQIRLVGPRQSQSFAVPASLRPEQKPKNQPPAVYVPGPLDLHFDWRETLKILSHVIPERKDLTFYLGWQWTDIALPERLAIRRHWLKNVPMGNVVMREAHPKEKFEVLNLCDVVVLGPLQDSWTRTVLSQTALSQGLWQLDHRQDWSRDLRDYRHGEQRSGAETTEPDSAINQLIRAYHQLLVH